MSEHRDTARQLRMAWLGAALDAWQAEDGRFTEAELDAAAAKLDAAAAELGPQRSG